MGLTLRQKLRSFTAGSAFKIFLKLSKKGGDPFNSQAFGDFALDKNSFATDKDQLGAYEQLAWAAVAVDRIAEAAGNQEIFFTDADMKEIDMDKVPDEIKIPFINGFAGLPFVGGLQPAIISHEKLTGNALYLKVKKTALGALSNMTEQFMPITPGSFRIKLNSNKTMILGYQITLGAGKRILAKPEDVIHFRQSTIFSSFWGVGNITKMRLTAEGDLAGDQFNNEFLNRRASPSLVVTDEQERNPEDFRRLLDIMREKYEGIKNSGKLMYLAGEGIKVQTMQLSQKDMQFLEQKKFSRQTILSIFGVPPVVAGVPEGVNRATAEIQTSNFLENNINMLLGHLEEIINTQFVHLIDPKIFVNFKRHLTDSVERVKDLISTAVISPNRGAEMLGEKSEPNDPGRNALYLPSNLFPISDGAPPRNVGNNNGSEEDPDKNKKGIQITYQQIINTPELIEKLRDQKNIDLIVTYFEGKLPESKRFQTSFLRASLKRRNSMVIRYTAPLGDFFAAQKRRVLKKFEELFIPKKILDKGSVDLIFNVNFENGEFQEEIVKLHTAGVQGAVRDSNQILKAQVLATSRNPLIKRTIDSLGRRIVSGTNKFGNKIGINLTTRKILQNIIVRGIDSGQTVNEIQGIISAKFDQFQGFRARMIARTESRTAYDAGSNVAFREVGVKTVDVLGCIGTSVDGDYGTMDELNTDCGRLDIPIEQASTLDFHPNHIGGIVPSEIP